MSGLLLGTPALIAGISGRVVWHDRAVLKLPLGGLSASSTPPPSLAFGVTLMGLGLVLFVVNSKFLRIQRSGDEAIRDGLQRFPYPFRQLAWRGGPLVVFVVGAVISIAWILDRLW